MLTAAVAATRCHYQDGVSVQRGSLPLEGGLCPKSSPSESVSVQRGCLCLGGLPLDGGGLLPWGVYPEGEVSLYKGSLSRDLCPGGVSV